MKTIIPKIYKPLFMPNHTPEESKKFTPQYKDELRRRLLRGETVSDDEIGIKTFVLKGGRISGKTKNDDIAVVQQLLEKERGDVWECRSEENTIRRTIFQSVQNEIRNLGCTISNRTDTDFKVCTSPFEIKCNLTGNVCQFFSINKDINRTKGFSPPSGKLKRVVLEEANEPDDSIYVEGLRSTALRFMDETSKFVYRYNPPPSLNAWANIYFPNLEKKGATIIHSTWRDIAELLEPSVIADILQMKRDDPLHYAFWYGGEVVSLEGLVIWSFDKAKHVIPLSAIQRKIRENMFYQPTFMFYGVDSGITSDATAVTAWALYPDAKLICLGTFYLDIKEEKRKRHIKGISHTDQVILMTDWLKAFKKQMSDWGIVIPDGECERWCFDGAGLTQDLMFELEKAVSYRVKAVTDKDVERDIARLINFFRSGQAFILDTPENGKFIWELEHFVRGEDNEIPEGQADHAIDSAKYATYEYYYDFL